MPGKRRAWPAKLNVARQKYTFVYHTRKYFLSLSSKKFYLIQNQLIMKHISFAFLLLLLAVSCKKDCPDCGENGICDENTSSCECFPGWTGAKCTKEIKPKTVTLNSVLLVKYPATNAGQAWDDFSNYADPYFVVTNGTTLETVYTSQYKDEINPASGALWPVGSICNPDDYFLISFYDYDSAGSDTFMGSVLWSAYVEGQAFPISVTQKDAGLEVQFLVSYQH